MVSNATVLVTGGTGFIGSSVAEGFLDDGHDVVAYDVSTDTRILDSLGIADETTVRRGDVTDATDVVRTVKATGTTHIVHLAGLLTSSAAANPRAALRVNVEGTNNVFEAARTLPEQVERVAWASSAAVYAPPENYTANDGWVTEEDLVYPDTLYGATKEYNEHQARVYNEAFDVSLVGLRPTVAYGPYRETGGSAFLTNIIENPALGESVSVEYGDQTIDWQYVTDIGQAFRKAAFAPESDVTQNVYNVRGEVATIREAADTVREILPDAEIAVSDEGELPWTQTLDMTKANEELGYEPEYDCETGFREYINVLREENGLDPVSCE